MDFKKPTAMMDAEEKEMVREEVEIMDENFDLNSLDIFKDTDVEKEEIALDIVNYILDKYDIEDILIELMEKYGASEIINYIMNGLVEEEQQDIIKNAVEGGEFEDDEYSLEDIDFDDDYTGLDN